ncbi:MAG: hypothetical protein CO042_03385 [Parcubacteria group bacterium CG_4_9_14_0_2_um_filter_41_8]|nr:MAG: hypothetical protein COW93_02665 [Parcubacteria group bacterium CG22_combo_CG10-13_8_21_14_all_41_9]PJC40512.1 MAG: hypothetical protein CO042_03385 [Parcubacteria group bacterium CG_4_9_14_0_2_um_filter_41_8]
MKPETLQSIAASLASHAKIEPKKGGKKDAHSRYEIKNKNYQRVLIHNARFLFTTDKDDHISILENHSIIIEGDIIKEVLPSDKVKQQNFDIVYDAGKRGGAVITPGLINTHAHIHMYLMRSAMMLDEGESIDETIAAMARWQKFETEAALAIAAIGDITEQQKYGITTTLTHGPSFEAAEIAAQSTKQNLINAVSAVSNSRPDNTPEMAAEYLKEKNSASIPAINIHYLYKASSEVLKQMRALQEQYNALFTFHMAESEFVAKQAEKIHGMRETALLEKHGLLNERTLASHVIYVTGSEIKKLVQHKVGIAHLPTSNAIHKSGTFKFWLFDEKNGAPYVSLGTDSVVSKSRLDILTEAYQARITHLYDNTIKFGSLFKMITANGARVLHMPDRGKILPGHKADICFWKLKDRGFVPYDVNNPITLVGNLITHGGRTVRDLMINGKFIIKDRKHLLINESELLDQTQSAHMQMRGKVEKGRA